MTITLPLGPGEAARLLAAAHARGVTADAFVRDAVESVLRDLDAEPNREPETPDTRDILSIIADSLKNVPPEDLAMLPADGASQIDHYICGSPKRDL